MPLDARNIGRTNIGYCTYRPIARLCQGIWPLGKLRGFWWSEITMGLVTVLALQNPRVPTSTTDKHGEHHLLIERLAYFDFTRRILGIMKTESLVRLLLVVGSCDSRLGASEAGGL